MTGAAPSRRRDLLLALLLLTLPAIAFFPALREARLLGPGDGAALHLPLRAAVWDAYQHGEMPGWNPWQFLGLPLLASYRPGALHPLMAVGALLPRFVAFQGLVVLSLGLAGALAFAYARRLGAASVGAYVAGLCFGLGPYLVGHLGDTATLVAAPALPLTMLCAEAWATGPRARAAAALAGSIALLLVSGSPQAARGGLALLAARLLVLHWRAAPDKPRRLATLLVVAAGLALAAPQLIPTLLAVGDAGRTVTGIAGAQDGLPGATGLGLRYLSHTPAPALAAAALPLLVASPALRFYMPVMALCLLLQWGRGALSAPGTLPLVFDFALAIVAGLSLSAQWVARREPAGRHLRNNALFAFVLSALGLSLAATVVGPLPQDLAAAVGVLALALILYHSLAASHDVVYAASWLLPLTVAFLLQPHGRRAWHEAPTRAELLRATGTREAIDRAMGDARDARAFTLVRDWPASEGADLGYAGTGSLGRRYSANGYEPMAPLRTRRALGGLRAGGTLPADFFLTEPDRLSALGVRWLQLPTGVLQGRPGDGYGERIDLRLRAGETRFVPLRIQAATDVRIVSTLSQSATLPQGTVVAVVEARLASGRSFSWPLRAGIETAEWAHDRPDVSRAAAHLRPTPFESWRDPAGFQGHRYATSMPLPGRYLIDSVAVEATAAAPEITLFRIALWDRATGQPNSASPAGAYVSDAARVREALATPAVRLFELPHASPAYVVALARGLASESAVLAALSAPSRIGADLSQETLVQEQDLPALVVPGGGGKASRAESTRRAAGILDIHAAGPGVLVVAEAWDPGWRATLDGAPVPLVRANGAIMALRLPAGTHRVTLRYTARGLALGLVLAVVAALGLGIAWRAERRAGRPRPVGGMVDTGTEGQ